MTSSSRKEMDENDNAHVNCLLYKLISGSRDNDDLSIGFQWSIKAREREMTNNKTITGKYHVRIYLNGFFSFAEYHDLCIYVLRYKLILNRGSDNHVMSHPAGANGAANLALAGRIFIEDKSLYVPHNTLIISNQKLIVGHILYLELQRNWRLLKDHLIWKM